MVGPRKGSQISWAAMINCAYFMAIKEDLLCKVSSPGKAPPGRYDFVPASAACDAGTPH